MGSSGERSISQGEMMNREVLAKSLVATCNIPPARRSPRPWWASRAWGKARKPNRLSDLIGKTLPMDKAAGDFFFPSDWRPQQPPHAPTTSSIALGCRFGITTLRALQPQAISTSLKSISATRISRSTSTAPRAADRPGGACPRTLCRRSHP